LRRKSPPNMARGRYRTSRAGFCPALSSHHGNGEPRLPSLGPLRRIDGADRAQQGTGAGRNATREPRGGAFVRLTTVATQHPSDEAPLRPITAACLTAQKPKQSPA
jgi:hypothetical protein